METTIQVTAAPDPSPAVNPKATQADQAVVAATDSTSVTSTPPVEATRCDGPGTPASKKPPTGSVVLPIDPEADDFHGLGMESIGATPKNLAEARPNVLEMRLRTVRDILKRQNDMNEQIMAFCNDTHRWMVNADAVMRENNIIPPAAVPRPPFKLGQDAVARDTVKGRTASTSMLSSQTSLGGDRTPLSSQPNKLVRGESTGFSGPYAMRTDSGGSGNLEAGSMLMSLLQPSDSKQQPAGHRRVRGGSPNNPRWCYQRPVDWDCDSENEDYHNQMAYGGMSQRGGKGRGNRGGHLQTNSGFQADHWRVGGLPQQQSRRAGGPAGTGQHRKPGAFRMGGVQIGANNTVTAAETVASGSTAKRTADTVDTTQTKATETTTSVLEAAAETAPDATVGLSTGKDAAEVIESSTAVTAAENKSTAIAT